MVWLWWHLLQFLTRYVSQWQCDVWHCILVAIVIQLSFRRRFIHQHYVHWYGTKPIQYITYRSMGIHVQCLWDTGPMYSVHAHTVNVVHSYILVVLSYTYIHTHFVGHTYIQIQCVDVPFLRTHTFSIPCPWLRQIDCIWLSPLSIEFARILAL